MRIIISSRNSEVSLERISVFCVIEKLVPEHGIYTVRHAPEPITSNMCYYNS